MPVPTGNMLGKAVNKVEFCTRLSFEISLGAS